MYIILVIGIMFAANIIAICPYSYFLSLQLHLVTPCIWLKTTHPWNSPHYGSWEIFLFFIICMHLWNVLKCIALDLITLIAARFLHLCVLASPAHLCMPWLFTHCLPTIICVVLKMSIVSVFLFSLVCFFNFVIKDHVQNRLVTVTVNF